MTDATETCLRLAFAGLAPRRVDQLIAHHGSVAAVVQAIESGKQEISPGVRASVSVPSDARRAQLAALGVAFSVPGATEVWSRLARFASMPRWLFSRGTAPEAPVVSIVGTRSCTGYGRELAAAYGRVAAEAGWVVVSGMARGIDGAAHRGTLDGGGTTIAVLGSGVDVIYPRGHRRLYEDILRSGCILSEFPPGTRPDAWRFPTRNRIISGLADVVLVVEAGETGGALITARIALDQGVPVFATPGDVDRTASVGTNLLIRDGACPVLDPDDLAHTLDLIVPFVAA